MNPNAPAGSLRFLRGAALLAAVAGGAGSLALMLQVARPPFFLLLFFIGWVLAPFLAFLALALRAQGASAVLCVMLLLITAASLLLYRNFVLHPLPKPAAPFLLVPLGSLVLLALAAFGSRPSRSR